MKLLMTPTSPYARKARVLVLEKQLNCEMEAVSPWDDDAQVLATNPLRKVPVLLADGGAAVFDSRVICEYLDSLSDSPRFLPADAAARLEVKTREALVEGAMDSALSLVMAGRAAPDMAATDSWKRWLLGKSERALDVLEKRAGARGGAADLDMGEVACFCFLDFWLFRQAQTGWADWRDSRPNLAEWFAKTGKRESFVQTDPRPPQKS